MKTQQEAERAEQQRIKNLVLNYDLQDSTDHHDGTASAFPSSPSSSFFSRSNPNLPASYFLDLQRPNAHKTVFQGIAPAAIVAAGDAGKHHGGAMTAHHQLHHASLNQQSSTTTGHAGNAKPATERSSALGRGAQRARKLQLSDVDWYEPVSELRPASSFRSSSRGRGGGRGRGRGGRGRSMRMLG